MDKEIALYCTFHPASAEKRDRAISLLRETARSFYRDPRARCIAWSYFTPIVGKKQTPPLYTAGLEVYTGKQALTDQLSNKHYLGYYEAVEREQLYSEPDSLVAWYRTLGFVARGERSEPSGDGVLVSCSRVTCRDRDTVLKLIEPFADWVRDNEPDVLTYIVFTRKKAPKEVLIFVRYKDGKAMNSHIKAPEHDELVKKMHKHLESDIGSATTMWRELPDSFVSTVPGGGQKSKL